MFKPILLICNQPDIFMPPWPNFLFGSEESELQAVPAITHSHSQHRYDVSAESLLQKNNPNLHHYLTNQNHRIEKMH